jgi:hypothetical protein
MISAKQALKLSQGLRAQAVFVYHAIIGHIHQRVKKNSVRRGKSDVI